MSKTLTTSVAFTDPQGNVLANGVIIFQLNMGAKLITNGEVVNVLKVSFTLTATGMMPGGAVIIANDELMPTGTMYVVTMFNSNGLLVRGPENWILSGTSPIDISTITSSSIPDPGLANPIIGNPSAPQTITGQSLTLTSTAPFVAQGPATFSGTTTVGTLNSGFYVDGVQFSGCPAAMTAATTYANGTTVTIPGTGPLVNCPAAGNAENIVTVNFDRTRDQCNAVTTNPPCSGVNWQYDDSNVFHMLRLDFTTAHQDNAGVSVALRPITTLKNATANNLSGIDGIAAEADTAGTLTGAFSNLQAAEHQITVGSTGGSFQTATGVLGRVNTSLGSTTTLTLARGIWAAGCGSITNLNRPGKCLGLDAADQWGTVGASGSRGNEYSVWSRGISLLGYSGSLGQGGLDAEDHLHVAHPFLSFDSSDNTILTAITASGILLQDSTPANQLKIDSSGLRTFNNFRYTEVAGPCLAPGAGADTTCGNSTDHTIHYNSNNNGESAFSGAWNCVNVTPVTVNANVATDQNLMTCSIPAGTLNRAGRTLRIWVAGIYSTPAASTTAIVVKAKLGALTLATWTSTALAGIQATNDQFNVTGWATTQTAGATAAFEVHGNLVIDLGVGNTVADSTFADVNTATVSSVDSTAAQTLQITIAFTVASGSNTATQRQLILETIN